MQDLIDRHAAIMHFVKVSKNYECGMFDLKEVTHELWQLPSAQPEQWIPCSEKMPDDYTDVLAWFEYYRYGNYNRMYQTYGIGTYSGEYASWMINHETGWQRLKVIAWMPLPEPYTGDDQ